MPFDDIESFISQRARSTKDENLLAVLRQVALFIGQSDKGFDAVEMKKALCYLSVMPLPMAMFESHPSRSLREALKEEGVPEVFDAEFLRQVSHEAHRKGKGFTIPKMLSKEAIETLKTLYKFLLEYYREPAWRYSYPENAFSDWEANLTKGTRYDSAADFGRNLSIEGEEGSSEEEAGQRIGKLVMQADYPAAMREDIVNWIKANGNQKMISCATDLFAKHHFGSEEINPVITQDKMDWSLEHGRVVFNYDWVVSGVVIGGQFLMAKQEGLPQRYEDVPEALLKEYQKLRDDRKPLPPLVHIKGQVALFTDDKGSIIPRVTECKVVSYTSELLSPERLSLHSPMAVRSNNEHKPR